MSGSSAALSLLSPVGGVPHGAVLGGAPALPWLLLAAHLLVGLASLAIPLALLRLARQQPGLRLNGIFVLFGIFMLSGGAAHLLSLADLCWPEAQLQPWMMAITAGISVASAAALIRLTPLASAFIDRRRRSAQRLQQMNTELQDQMGRFFDLAVAQRQSQVELMMVQDASPLGQFRTDTAGGVIYVNRMFEQICGLPQTAMMGTAWLRTIHAEDLPRVAHDWDVSVQSESVFASRHRVQRPDGRVAWVSAKAAPVRLDGKVTGYVGSVDDLTALHHTGEALNSIQLEEESRLRSQLLTDPLTGLGNRAGFEQALKAARNRHARAARPGPPRGGVAVLFADLDHLKTVNDTLGHATGDRLIQAFAERLRQGLRVTDYCARWGGDEFTVVLENVHSQADMDSLCEKLLAEIGRPFLIAGQPQRLSASLGLACHLGPGAFDIDSLLQQADGALYAAKRGGRNTYRIHPSI